MSDISLESRPRVRGIISIVACILIGVTLLFAGVGKVAGWGQMPGQTEFLDKLIPDFLLTPAVAYFMGEVFIPYIMPFVEIALGILLIIGLWPRLIAVFSLLMTLAFITHNSWAISQGAKFPECPCFGIWEKILGSVSPLQSLCIDIGLFALALVIIFVHPGTFFSSQPWLTKHKKKTTGQQDN